MKYRVYRNKAAAAYLSLYCSFFFLSNFQTLKFFVTLFSGIVRPWRLKLIPTWTMGGCIVYTRIMLSLYFFIYFFLSNFHKLQFFVTLFWGTVRPWRLKLGTHVDSGQIYCAYRNQAAAAYLSLYFFNFLSLQFSNIKIFHRIKGKQNKQPTTDILTWCYNCRPVSVIQWPFSRH